MSESAKIFYWKRRNSFRPAPSAMMHTVLFGRRVNAIGFFALLAAATLASILWLDRPIADWMHDIDWGYTPYWRAVTQLGDSAYYFAALAILTACCAVLLRKAPDFAARHGLRERMWQAVFAFAAILGTGIMLNVLKYIFGRPRPSQFFDGGRLAFEWLNITGRYGASSLPSGHATTIWTVALVAYLLLRVPAWPLIAVAVLVSVSRVVLENHYLGDTIAGAWTGLFGTVVICALWQRYLPAQPQPWQKLPQQQAA